MKTILIVVLLCFSINSFAQTKLIFHKSHSGSTINFRKATEGNLFGTSGSNFGLQEKSIYRLDSVIYLTQNKVILITSTLNYGSESIKKEKLKNQKNWIKSKTTLSDYPLFSKNLPLDSIKKQLTEKQFFGDAKNTIYVGFPKASKTQRK